MTTSDEEQPLSGWDAHRRAQLVNGLNATPVQRLRWLEEAIAFAFRTGALPRPPTDPEPTQGRTPNVTMGPAQAQPPTRPAMRKGPTG